MRILIVEDEPLAAERLEQLILEYESHMKIVAKKDAVSSTIQWLKENEKPDLAFFDIQLADGLSFMIFEQMKVDFPVIFTTAFDEYAIQAFKVNSVDYLLKPIEFESLANAIDKFVKIHQPFSQQSQKIDFGTIQQLISSVHQQKNYKARFVVKKGEHLYSIAVEDIAFFYSEDKYTFFKTTASDRFMIDHTLGELELMLDPEKFFRLNRQYLISHQAIKDIISHSHSRLKVQLSQADDDHIIVSKQKVAEFKKWLGA